MSVMDWLKRALAGEHPPQHPVTFAAGEEQFHGLNMKSAIDAHLNWKYRLEAQIRGDTAEHLEVGSVATDENCVLGKWLHGDARQRFGVLPEYQELVKAHADFHLTAGDILAECHLGERDKAQQLLATDLRRLSDKVQLALVRLYAKGRG